MNTKATPNIPDVRYTVRLEGTGAPKPEYVARFCGEFIGAKETQADAEALTMTDYFRRMKEYFTKTEQEHIAPYLYARRNGYRGSISDYVVMQYNTYAGTCLRNGINPMPFEQWETK